MRWASCSLVKGIGATSRPSLDPLAHGPLLDPLLVVAAQDDALNEDRWDVNLIRIDLAHLHQLLHLGDRHPGCHAHQRRKVAGGLTKDEVSPLVTLEGADDREVGDERRLEHVLPPVDGAGFLPGSDLSPHPGRSVEASNSTAASSYPLGQGALRVELHLELTAEELALELFVLPDVAGHHLLNLLGLEQDAESEIGGAAVIGNDGEVLHPFSVEGGDQVLRISTEAEAAAHHHRPVLDVADCFVRGGDHLVHLSPQRSTIIAIPSPPPMHSEATPRRLFRSFIA